MHGRWRGRNAWLRRTATFYGLVFREAKLKPEAPEMRAWLDGTTRDRYCTSYIVLCRYTHTRDAFQVNKASKQFENNFYRFHEPIIQYSTVLRHQQQIAKVISKMRHNRNIPEHLFNKMPAEGGKYFDFLWNERYNMILISQVHNKSLSNMYIALILNEFVVSFELEQ